MLCKLKAVSPRGAFCDDYGVEQITLEALLEESPDWMVFRWILGHLWFLWIVSLKSHLAAGTRPAMRSRGSWCCCLSRFAV